MDNKEEWQFWTARAFVTRAAGRTIIELRGVVTAPVYEALHMRMGCGPADGKHLLLLDWPALLACTNISAMDAAVRGSPAALFSRGGPLTIRVPEARLQWAREHCNLMCGTGLRRQVLPLEVPAFQRLKAAA